jgi:DnaJ-class molecular chaperone
METVKRAHPAETGDSQADQCPACNGGGKYPAGTQRAGQTCEQCAGAGFLLRQRRDANGNPTRVALVDEAGAAIGVNG